MSLEKGLNVVLLFTLLTLRESFLDAAQYFHHQQLVCANSFHVVFEVHIFGSGNRLKVRTTSKLIQNTSWDVKFRKFLSTSLL